MDEIVAEPRASVAGDDPVRYTSTPLEPVPIRCVAVSAHLLRLDVDAARVLLLRRSSGDFLAGEWCQVSGRIEAGETAWQAALREIREETGLVPERFYSAGVCEQFYEPTRNHISLLPVFVGFVSAHAVVTLNAEHSEARWMTFAEAEAAVTFGGQRSVLAHVRREFVDREPTEWLRIELSVDH
jgi:dATP pyrophosphohydrolase